MPDQALRVLVRQRVHTDLPRRVVQVPAQLAVLVQRPVRAEPRLAQRVVLARWVLRPVPADLHLSRPSF